VTSELDWLNLTPGIGQRSITYTFTLIDGATGENRGLIHPLRDASPTLAHDTTSTISRRVTGLTLDPADAALFRPLIDRVDVAMVIPGAGTYPLGRYMAADDIQIVTSGGNQRPLTLYDEMLIVDQDMETSFDAGGIIVSEAIRKLIAGLPINTPLIETTTEISINSWAVGSARGTALKDLASVGGYFKPWFDHHNIMQFTRIFDPAQAIVDFDWDKNPRVIADSITRTNEIPTAPNRFIIVSNTTGVDTSTQPMVGVYDVPATAPHSIINRGFVLPQVQEAQVGSAGQAATYARAVGVQRTVAEIIECSTPPDPRHDSYQVIRFDDTQWLETAWTLTLTAGGEMRHTLRRTYPATTET
jgi:hypothetical protein